MNRTDRLLAIVLELQGKGMQRAEDLAATFEVSKRTIYRDIEALNETGVPVVSSPGHGYSLVEGYFLPPLSFTSDEAILLLLGSDVMAGSFDAEYRAAAQSAGRKIAGVLPEPRRAEVRTLRESIHFIAEEPAQASPTTELLASLRRAIIKRQTIRFRYTARQGAIGIESSRKADPHALVHVGGVWYLVAYCHLRQRMRNFRLDRIERLVLLNHTFERRPGLSAQPSPDSSRHLLVRVLFDQNVARWVRETPSFFSVAEEERPDGLLVTLRVRREDDITQWLLSWGAHVQVLEPDSLRARLAAEAEGMWRNFQMS